jgi:Gpi18-like mannosyltransferase
VGSPAVTRTPAWQPGAGTALSLLILAVLAVRLLLYAAVAGSITQLPQDLCVWDCNWFLNTARLGYDVTPHVRLGVTHDQADWVNFPIFPGIIALLFWFGRLPLGVSGFIAANLSLGVFVYFAVKYLEIVTGVKNRLAMVLFLFAFPYGIYFSMTYTESTYAALGMMTFYFFARGEEMRTVLASALFSATRVTGVLFAPVIAAGYVWRAWRVGRKSGMAAAAETIAGGLLPIALAPLGLFLFMFYLYLHAGDAFGFLHIQRAWGRSEHNPVSVLINGVFANDLGLVARGRQSQSFATLCALAGLALSVRLLILKRFAEAWFLLASIMIALSAGLLSFPRYCLTDPIFVVWSFEAVWNLLPRRLFIAVLLACVVIQLWLVHLLMGQYAIFI